MRSPYCPICKAVTEAVAYPTDYSTGETLEGIVINTEGSSAGRWADGTHGTTDEQDDLANGEEAVFCLTHQSQECDRIDVAG